MSSLIPCVMLCNYTLTLLYISVHQGEIIVIGTLKLCVCVCVCGVVTIRNSETSWFETECVWRVLVRAA